MGRWAFRVRNRRMPQSQRRFVATTLTEGGGEELLGTSQGTEQLWFAPRRQPRVAAAAVVVVGERDMWPAKSQLMTSGQAAGVIPEVEAHRRLTWV